MTTTEPNQPENPQQGKPETETKASSGPVDPQTGEPLKGWDSQPEKASEPAKAEQAEQADKPATKATKK